MPPKPVPTWLAASAGLVLGALAACGGPDESDGRVALQLPEHTEDGLRMVHSDTDDDGRPDVIKYFRDELDEVTDETVSTLVRTELDLNNDGQINMRRTYDEYGELTLEEMDGNLDGRMDHIVFWENGVIMGTETDTDRNGQADEFREYREGLLSQVRRDSDGDGEVDTWSYYDQQGLARVGYDTNGDGQADRWSRRSE